MACSYECILVALLALLQTAAVGYCALSPEFPADVQLISVGGRTTTTDYQSTSDVDVISIASNSHRRAVPMPTARFGFGSTIVNDTILVVGGHTGHADAKDEFLSYQPSTNTWTNLPNFPYAIFDNAVVAFKGSIYSFGGDAGDEYGYMNYTYKYDFSKQKWSRSKTPLPMAEVYSACAVADESSIYLILNGETYRTDDGAHTWTKLSSMIERRVFAACVMSESGVITMAGGMARDSTRVPPLNSVEVYDVSTDTWSQAPSMTIARADAQAVVIPASGEVVVCGGAHFQTNAVYSNCELFSPKQKWNSAAFSLNMPRMTYGFFVSQV